MSYNFRLYNTPSASNKINKNIDTVIRTVEINFKEKNNNLEELDILLNINESFIKYINYARITYAGRILYYFVKILPTSKGDELYNFHLTLDPLMTYRDEILGLSVITDRNTNKYNVYLPDSEQKITSQYKQFYHTFKGGDISHFKPHSSILCTLVGSE